MSSTNQDRKPQQATSLDDETESGFPTDSEQELTAEEKALFYDLC